MSQKVYVGGMPFSTTSGELRELFVPYGSVLTADVVTDQMTGQSRGFGFVEMSTVEEAQNAISKLNGRDLGGRRLMVNVAKPKTEGGGHRGGFRGR